MAWSGLNQAVQSGCSHWSVNHVLSKSLHRPADYQHQYSCDFRHRCSVTHEHSKRRILDTVWGLPGVRPRTVMSDPIIRSDRVRILLADSSTMRSQLLSGALRRRPEFKVVSCSMSSDSILKPIQAESIDIILAN